MLATPAPMSDHRAIFLAEDDADCRLALAATLQQDGHRVVCVGNGAALLSRLYALRAGDLRPALVIADQRMPGMTGSYVLERARQWGMHVPFVLITGFEDAPLLERVRRMGAAILRKPVDGDDLCRLARHCMTAPATAAMRCAACGSQLDLHGGDEEGEVFFCGECYALGHGGDPNDPLMEFGGGD
jgi:CheY-like chemotaxis protein